MKYTTLSKEQLKKERQGKVQALELEHYRLSLELRIAQANGAKGKKGADERILDLDEKMQALEASLSALTDDDA